MAHVTLVNDLTTGSVPRKLTRFALPFVLSNLLQIMYGLVDMVIIGRYVGSTGLSAVSIGADCLLLVSHIGVGFAVAGQTIISQYVGMGDSESRQKTVGTMFVFISALSLAVTAACFLAAEGLLGLLNTPEQAFSQALEYTTVCYTGVFFVYGYNMVSSVLRGMGDSKRPLLFVGIAALTNLALDLLFVAALGMGTGGAALATVIGQGLSFVVSLIYLYRHRSAFGFDFKLKSFAVDGTKLKLIAKLGLPMTLQACAISISMLFVSSYTNAFGVVASAVTGIGAKIGSITMIVTNALSMSGVSMIGQNLGAGKPDRIPKIIRFSLIVDLCFALILSLAITLYPRQIFSLWSAEAEVLEMARDYVPVAVISFFGYALRGPFMALTNGIGHALLSMFIGIIDGVIARVGLSLLLGVALGYGIKGFWYGNMLAGLVPFFIGGGYYLSGRWKTRVLPASKK